MRKRSNLKPIVYIVDDEAAMRSSLCRLVESVGLEAIACETGEAFFQAYDGSRPGCLVLDIRMPTMSGPRILESIRDRDLILPVIMITAYADMRTAVRAMKAGALDVLEKPFNDQTFLDRVQTAIDEDLRNRKAGVEHETVRERMAHLTSRERQVFDLLSAGERNKDIARRLGIGRRTVEGHRAEVMRKLQVSNVVDLVRAAEMLGSSDMEA